MRREAEGYRTTKYLAMERTACSGVETTQSPTRGTIDRCAASDGQVAGKRRLKISYIQRTGNG